MSKHKIERGVPNNDRAHENIPAASKSHTIVANPPWQASNGNHRGAVKHYTLLPLEHSKDNKNKGV